MHRHLHLASHTASQFLTFRVPISASILVLAKLRCEENRFELLKHATIVVHASRNATKHGLVSFAERTISTASTKTFLRQSTYLYPMTKFFTDLLQTR
jgi:hypothetical protein